MKFGIFLLLQSPDMLPSQETYDHALEQGRLAFLHKGINGLAVI